MLTYRLVTGFTPDDVGNPSVEELNSMMMYSTLLTEQGYELDPEFMVKFGQALVEALAREKKDE